MSEYSRFSLLETVLLDTGCRSLSDLSAVSTETRRKIAEHILREIPEDAPTLQDYNEVLHYLLCEGPKTSKEAARRSLLDGLRA